MHVEYHGLDGLRAAEEFQPTWVLVDLGLPGINGYELMQCLRA